MPCGVYIRKEGSRDKFKETMKIVNAYPEVCKRRSEAAKLLHIEFKFLIQ